MLANLIPLDTYAMLAAIYSYIVLYQMVSNATLMDAFTVNLPPSAWTSHSRISSMLSDCCCFFLCRRGRGFVVYLARHLRLHTWSRSGFSSVRPSPSR